MLQAFCPKLLIAGPGPVHFRSAYVVRQMRLYSFWAQARIYWSFPTQLKVA